MENEPSPLKRVVDKIKEEGLPDKELMREQLNDMEKKRVVSEIESKLSRYKELFGKWKRNETSEIETEELLSLNEELTAFLK